MDCIFCSIAKHESPADIVAETPDMIVFKSIKPSAPIHLLVVPRRHIASVADLADTDSELAGEVIQTARRVARDQGLEGYKLIFNVGRKGGQVVDHVHLHLLGGWQGDAEE
jgi:histidine triad (HIT) family protein